MASIQVQQNIKTQSGNRIDVFFGGIKIGGLSSVSAADDYAPEPASGIGDIHVFEYVPTMARHTIQVSGMVLKIGSLRAAGVAVENGDAVLQGLVFDIVVQDKDTGKVLRKYVSCSYASGNVDIQKHSILVNSGQFYALDAQGVGV
jgi:hypothetical protein